MKIYMYIKKYVSKHKTLMVSFVFLSVILWGITLAYPYITGLFIDTLLISKNKNIVYYFTSIWLSIGICQIIFSYLNGIIVTKLKNKISFDLNFYILEYLKRLPIKYFYDKNITYLNQRINLDSYSLVSFFLDNVITLPITIVSFIFIAYKLYKVGLSILIALIILIILYLIIYNLSKDRLYNLSYETKEKQNEFFSKMNEQLSNIRIIKINSWFDILGEELKKSFNNLYLSTMKYAKVIYKFSSIDPIINLALNVVVFIYAGIKIIDKELTLGEFVTINSYVSIVLGYISYLVNISKSYQDAMVSYERLNDINNNLTETNGQLVLDNIHSIDFINVSFSYSDYTKVLDNFNYKFQKGNIYCIVGKNGSGKSTFLDLLAGIIHDYSGEILFNSVNIKNLNMYKIRELLFSVVEQEPSLFNDTIINNIRYNSKRCDYNTLKPYCECMGLDNLVLKNNDGLNLKIGDNSSNISGGEKQKIALIRALMKETDLIILDEPSSAMDKKSIENLKFILKGLKDKLVIIVTHSDDLLDLTDNIIRF